MHEGCQACSFQTSSCADVELQGQAHLHCTCVNHWWLFSTTALCTQHKRWQCRTSQPSLALERQPPALSCTSCPLQCWKRHRTAEGAEYFRCECSLAESGGPTQEASVHGTQALLAAYKAAVPVITSQACGDFQPSSA